MAISIKKSGNFIPGNKIRFSGGGGGFKAFLTAPPLPLINYYDTYLGGLEADSDSEDFYVVGTADDRGFLWKSSATGGGNFEDFKLEVYDDSGDVIVASTWADPKYISFNDGILNIFGGVHTTTNSGVFCLWRFNASTQQVSSTLMSRVVGDPSYNGIGNALGLVCKSNGEVVCGAGNTIFTVDSLGQVSSSLLPPDALGNIQFGGNLFRINDLSGDVFLLGRNQITKIGTELSGTVFQGGPSAPNVNDMIFGDDDEVFVCGDSVVRKILTNSGYTAPHPFNLSMAGGSINTGAYSLVKMISSSVDGNIWAFGLTAFSRPFLSKTSDKFETVDLIQIEPDESVAWNSLRAQMEIDSLGNIWIMHAPQDDNTLYYYKVDKDTNAVTKSSVAAENWAYLISPDSDLSSSDVKLFSSNVDVYVPEIGTKTKIGVVRFNPGVSPPFYTSLAVDPSKWPNDLALLAGEGETPPGSGYGDSIKFSWDAPNSTSVDLRYYNSETSTWDILQSDLPTNVSNYLVQQGFGVDRSYKLDVKSLPGYRPTNYLVNFSSSLYWETNVVSQEVDTDCTWVLGNYTQVASSSLPTGVPLKRNILWKISDDNTVVSGTILGPGYPADERDKIIGEGLDVKPSIYDMIINDEENGKIYALTPDGSLSPIVGGGATTSTLWTFTKSTGEVSGTSLTFAPSAMSRAKCFSRASDGTFWVVNDSYLSRIDPVTSEVSGTSTSLDQFVPQRMKIDSSDNVWVLFSAPNGSIPTLLKMDSSTYEITSTQLTEGFFFAEGRNIDFIFSGSNEDIWTAGRKFQIPAGVQQDAPLVATVWKFDTSTAEISSTYLEEANPQGSAGKFVNLADNGEIFVTGITTSSSISILPGGGNGVELFQYPVLWRLYGSPTQVSSTIIQAWDYPTNQIYNMFHQSQPTFDDSGNLCGVVTYVTASSLTPIKDCISMLWKFNTSTQEITSVQIKDGATPVSVWFPSTLRFDNDGNFNMLDSILQPPQLLSTNAFIRFNSSGEVLTNPLLAVTGGYGAPYGEAIGIIEGGGEGGGGGGKG